MIAPSRTCRAARHWPVAVVAAQPVGAQGNIPAQALARFMQQLQISAITAEVVGTVPYHAGRRAVAAAAVVAKRPETLFKHILKFIISAPVQPPIRRRQPAQG